MSLWNTKSPRSLISDAKPPGFGESQNRQVILDPEVPISGPHQLEYDVTTIKRLDSLLPNKQTWVRVKYEIKSISRTRKSPKLPMWQYTDLQESFSSCYFWRLANVSWYFPEKVQRSSPPPSQSPPSGFRSKALYAWLAMSATTGEWEAVSKPSVERAREKWMSMVFECSCIYAPWGYDEPHITAEIYSKA